MTDEPLTNRRYRQMDDAILCAGEFVNAQIKRIADRIEQMRLEEVPDVEMIRKLQSDLEALQKVIGGDIDSVKFFPI